MNFLKVHGLGNDFILVDGLADSKAAETAAANAPALCDRHFGIGADGVLLVLPGARAPLRIRIFNPDGSEAEMCGNGIRCFARYAYEHALARETTFPVDTLAGVVYPTLNLKDGKVESVSVDMGVPRFAAADIPIDWPNSPVVEQPLSLGNRTVLVTCLSMGNPHCVVYVDDVKRFPVAEFGPQLENHPAFPNRTNVEFAQVFNTKEVRARVWERGVGETLACGTGACAITVASALTKRTSREVKVTLPGGSLQLAWRENDHVIMTGPAEYVFEGRIVL